MESKYYPVAPTSLAETKYQFTPMGRDGKYGERLSGATAYQMIGTENRACVLPQSPWR